jgi:hypothetical protein
MATPKKIFLLVNDTGEKSALDITFGDSNPSNNEWNFADWDLDGGGNIRLIQQQDSTVQSILKCVFTEKQDNGYGSGLSNMIGEKDIIVRRTSLLFDLTMGVIALKSFNDAQAVAQDLSDDDLISSISKFEVKEAEDNPSKSIVSLTILTNSGNKVAVGVL